MNMSIGGASSAAFMRPPVTEVSPAAAARTEDATYRADLAGTNGRQVAGASPAVDGNGPPQSVGGPPPAGAKGPPPPGAGGPPPSGAGDAEQSDLSSLFAAQADEATVRETVLASEETIVQALLENARLAVESNADAADEDAEVADASADRAEEAERQMSEGRRAAQVFESQLSVMRAAFVGEDVAVTDLRV